MGGDVIRAWRLLVPVVLVVLVGLLVACGSKGSDRIEVSRVTVLPADLKQVAFVVVRPKSQDSVEEFDAYADQVAKRLAEKGMVRVDKAAKARYALLLSYDEGPEAFDTALDKRRKSREKDDEMMMAAKAVTIAIFDLTRPNRIDEKVFGARARCSAFGDGATCAAAPLIDAALKDFPGGGEDDKFSVRLPSK